MLFEAQIYHGMMHERKKVVQYRVLLKFLSQWNQPAQMPYQGDTGVFKVLKVELFSGLRQRICPEFFPTLRHLQHMLRQMLPFAMNVQAAFVFHNHFVPA